MTLRFRKSIKIMPGVRLNASLSGLSATVGRRGASVNIGKRGVRGTVGVPGSGLSYSERLSGPRVARAQPQPYANTWVPGERLKVTLVVVVVSAIGTVLALLAL